MNTMISLDHTILQICNPAKSISFYRQVLGFKHEGKAGPFKVLRVNTGLTIDLLQQVPGDQVHLAFCVDRATFDWVHKRLIQKNIPFDGNVFERDGLVAANVFGARSLADALYFYDPDQHNIEICVHPEQT